MRSTQLFEETLRRDLRNRLAASGAEFGIIEIRHGMMQQKTTLILYTDMTSEDVHFVPEVMKGVNGKIDFRIGRDQIWIQTDAPIRKPQIKKMTSRQRDPLKVKVDVFQRHGRYELNILVPLAMNVATLAIVVDTASMYRNAEPELPAMTMMSSLFETVGVQTESMREHPAEAMARQLQEELQAALGPEYRVATNVQYPGRKPEPHRPPTMSEYFTSLLGGGHQPRKKSERADPITSLLNGIFGSMHETDSETLYVTPEGLERLRRVQSMWNWMHVEGTTVRIYSYSPQDHREKVAAVKGLLRGEVRTTKPSAGFRVPVLSEDELRALAPGMPPLVRRELETENCDECPHKGRCSKEQNVRGFQRILGITPKSRRGHGVTDDPWDSLMDLGALFGHPSFVRSRSERSEERVCMTCSARDMCDRSTLGSCLEGCEAYRQRNQIVCEHCSAQATCDRGSVVQCQAAFQAALEQCGTEAESAEAGDMPASDTVVATVEDTVGTVPTAEVDVLDAGEQPAEKGPEAAIENAADTGETGAGVTVDQQTPPSTSESGAS